jgi:hypothetical protein
MTMPFITFLNANSDIIQIFLGVTSLIVSAILAFLIYGLQRSHEEQNASDNEQRRKEALSENAKVFLIDNDEEFDYLPLCVMASSISKYSKSKRKVYTRFKRCSAELQTEILRQANIPITITPDNTWLNEYLNKMIADSEKTKLGRNIFYDGAKYFHRGLESYAEYGVENINTHIFSVPQLSEISVFKDISNHADFTLYIDRYLELVLLDHPGTKDKPELLPKIPPYDYLWDSQSLGNCEEAFVSFWEMQAVISTCIAFFRHRIVGQDNADWRQIDSGDAKIETFEDLYYKALLVLYTAYAPRASLSEQDKEGKIHAIHRSKLRKRGHRSVPRHARL